MIVCCKEERIKCKPLCKVKYCRYQRDVLFSGDCTFQRNGSFNKHQSIQSVQFCCSVVSDSLSSQGLQHARLPSLSITNYRSLLKLMSIQVGDAIQPSHSVSSRSQHSISDSSDTIQQGYFNMGKCEYHYTHLFLLLSPLIRISTLLTSYDYRLIYSFQSVITIELGSLSVLSTIIIGASDMVLK